MLTWAKIWSVARFLILTTKLPWKNMAVVQLPFSPQNAPNSEGCAWYMRTALSTSWQRDFGSPLWSRDPRVNMFIPFQRWTQVNHRNLWADLEFRFKPGSNNHLAASQRSTQPVPKISHPTLHLRCDGHGLRVQALCRSTQQTAGLKRLGCTNLPTATGQILVFINQMLKLLKDQRSQEFFTTKMRFNCYAFVNSPCRPAAWTCDSRSHRSRWFSVHEKTSGFFQKNIFSFFGFEYHPYIWTVGHSGGLNLFGSNILRVWPQAGWSTTPKQKGPNIYPKWWYAGPKWSKKLYTSAMSFQHKHQSSIWILSPSRTHDLGNGIASPAHQLTFN